MIHEPASTGFTLDRNPSIPAAKGPVVLLILDGVGFGPRDAWDAVYQARTPNLDALRGRSLYRHLRAHGIAVGLPSDEDMGNSEVGHNALGAGRVFDQGAKLVDAAIASGEIFGGTWEDVVGPLRGSSTAALHLIGLLSDGNVHSHEKHLWAMLRRAAEEGIARVRVHPLLDGRDVPETSALIYLERLEQLLAELRGDAGLDYRIASGGGRMVTTMDRYEADWEIVARGYRAHVHGEGRGFASATEAVETYRAAEPGLIDQYIPPFVIVDDEGRPVGPIRDGDGVVFFNFRGDRAIEISRAFEEEEFDAFDRGAPPAVRYAGMMLYDGDLSIPRSYLVAPPSIRRTLGEYLCHNGVRQFACAETQKYGHVTYFWNGNRSGKFDEGLEEYLEIPSDSVPFDQRPWMKSAETADALLAALRRREFDFLRVNFAAGDMVGHTGRLEAAILAVESIDLCLGRLVPEVEALGGSLVVTADHGNSDDMVERDKAGNPKLDESGRARARTSHTLNPVELMILDPRNQLALRGDLPQAGLANVAATLLELLGWSAPEDYEPSLLEVG